MGQRCTICSNPDRLEIDRQIVKGVPHLKIGKTFGLNNVSIGNHARDHLSRQLLTATDIAKRASADVLMGEVDLCLNKAKNILAQAEEDKKPTLQLQAIREIRQTVEFLSKLAINLAQLQQAREIAQAECGGDLPEITAATPPKEAARIYKQLIERGKTGGKWPTPSAVVILPAEIPIPDDNEPPKEMKHTTQPGILPAEQAGEHVAELEPEREEVETDIDEKNINEILEWEPDRPKRSGVGSWGSR